MHPVEKIATLADIWDEFVARAHGMVWCNLTTLDRRGRPRSRVLHPIWDGQTGWIGTLHHTPKVRHIERDPHVSLAYIADVMKPVYADCVAEWVGEQAEIQRVWELFKNAPPPLGYDPAEGFAGLDLSDFGLIKLTPFRVEVTNWPINTRLWQRSGA